MPSIRTLVFLGPLTGLVATGLVACHHGLEGSGDVTSARHVDAHLTPKARPAGDLEHAFEVVAARAAPSVVSVVSTRTVSVGPMMRFGPPLEPHLTRGLGSGVVLDRDGHILTNNHVVAGAQRLKVRFSDDSTADAKVVGTDPHADIAVIQVERREGLVPATFGSSSALRVGQWVVAYGSPFGLENTVSSGIVSAVDRTAVGIADYEDFIQTDAAINPGNSGGPLLDLDGAVVGINTAIASTTGGSHGVGFAVPIDMAKRLATELISNGKVVRGWLGVALGELTPELAASFGYDGRGVLVQEVQPETPAEKAGLRAGDVVLEVDGLAFDDVRKLRNSIAAERPGERVKLAIWRDGQRREVSAELGTLPEPEAPVATAEVHDQSGRYGLGLVDVTPELAHRLRLGDARGAVVGEVKPGSIAEEAGLQPGDVIERVGDHPISDAESAVRALKSAPDDRPVALYVRRDHHGQFIALRRPSADRTHEG